MYNGTDYTYLVEDQGYCSDDSLRTFYAVFQTVLYSSIFLLGVAGNGLMITVLLRRWRLLRINEIYLLHLAMADLMLLFTFPFTVVENFTGWVFGKVLCKLIVMGQHLNLLCGSFLLAFIGFDRYLAIVLAISSLQSRRRRTVHLTCAVLWLVCLALSVPNIVFFTAGGTNTSTDCSVHEYGIKGSNWVLTSRVFDHVCFFLPLAVMSYCYAAVVLTLFKSRKSQAKQGAIRLAILITLIFCFCWLPHNITLLVMTMNDLEVIKYNNCDSYLTLETAYVVTKSLGFSHCCLNPFLYAFVGVRFHNELIQLLRKLGCGKICVCLTRDWYHHGPNVSERTTTDSTVFTQC